MHPKNVFFQPSHARLRTAKSSPVRPHSWADQGDLEIEHRTPSSFRVSIHEQGRNWRPISVPELYFSQSKGGKVPLSNGLTCGLEADLVDPAKVCSMCPQGGGGGRGIRRVRALQ